MAKDSKRRQPQRRLDHRQQQLPSDAGFDMADFERQVGKLFAMPVADKVWEGLQLLFYHRSSFVKGDPYHTSFKEGQRDVIGFINECMVMVREEAAK